MAERKEKFCLVIGGAGFLGQRMAEQLVADGKRVRVFDIRPSPDPNVESVVGDLRSLVDVSKALASIDTVYHTASLTETTGPRQLFFDINVTGTQNVIDCCVAAGVSRLVYTSSASVVFGGRDIINGDESLPYPPAFLDAYSESKALAEARVLAANGRMTLAGHPLSTCAIRPHTIFGPRDVHVFPRIFQNAAAGKLKYILGAGTEMHDYTFVDNCVLGHRLAAKSLCAADSPAAGQAYFITNGEPRPFWATTYELVNRMGYNARARVRIPAPIAGLIAWLMIAIAWILSPVYTFRPTLTRYVVANVTTSHFFSIAKAKRDLGYEPAVSLDAAFDQTIAWFHANGYAAGAAAAGAAGPAGH